MSIIQGLQEFDLMRGKEPINPTRIDGFGPGSPPPPIADVPIQSQPPVRSAQELYGDPIEVPGLAQGLEDEGVGSFADSPLVQAGLTGQAAPVTSRASSGAAALNVNALSDPPELVVWGNGANYRGHAVELQPAEMSALTKIVLKAVRRQIEEFYVQVAGSKPRQRKPREKAKKK